MSHLKVSRLFFRLVLFATLCVPVDSLASQCLATDAFSAYEGSDEVLMVQAVAVAMTRPEFEVFALQRYSKDIDGMGPSEKSSYIDRLWGKYDDDSYSYFYNKLTLKGDVSAGDLIRVIDSADSFIHFRSNGSYILFLEEKAPGERVFFVDECFVLDLDNKEMEEGRVISEVRRNEIPFNAVLNLLLSLSEKSDSQNSQQ